MRLHVLAFIALMVTGAAACFGGCAAFMILGIDWLTIGRGLHPAIAFAGCVTAATGAAALLLKAYDEFLTERERLNLVLEYTNKHLPIHIWPDRAP